MAGPLEELDREIERLETQLRIGKELREKLKSKQRKGKENEKGSAIGSELLAAPSRDAAKRR